MTISMYSSVHQRLRRRNGRAADWLCIRCGKQAKDWAHIGTGWYSEDLGEYVPMCRSCHTLMDPHFERDKTHCPSGHAYTDDNTIRYNGRRKCKACHRTQERERRQSSTTRH